MEPTITSSNVAAPVQSSSKQTSWGVLIGLLLILIVIVASALYVFEQRINPTIAPATTTSAV